MPQNTFYKHSNIFKTPIIYITLLEGFKADWILWSGREEGKAQKAGVLYGSRLESLDRIKHFTFLGPFVICEENEVLGILNARLPDSGKTN